MKKIELKELFQAESLLIKILAGIVVLLAGYQLWAKGLLACVTVILGSFFLILTYSVVLQVISLLQGKSGKCEQKKFVCSVFAVGFVLCLLGACLYSDKHAGSLTFGAIMVLLMSMPFVSWETNEPTKSSE